MLRAVSRANCFSRVTTKVWCDARLLDFSLRRLDKNYRRCWGGLGATPKAKYSYNYTDRESNRNDDDHPENESSSPRPKLSMDALIFAE